MSVQPDCVSDISPNRDMANLHGIAHLIEPLPPAGERAILTGQPAALSDVRSDPPRAVWRNEAGQLGYEAAATRPGPGGRRGDAP